MGESACARAPVSGLAALTFSLLDSCADDHSDGKSNSTSGGAFMHYVCLLSTGHLTRRDIIRPFNLCSDNGALCQEQSYCAP